MNRSVKTRKIVCIFILFFSFLSLPPVFAGIPEPGIVMYGQVLDNEGTLITSGDLTWTFTPAAGGTPVTVNTQLHPVKGTDGADWSYWALVPMETEAPGFPVSSNAIPLTSSAVTYTRTGHVQGTDISFTDTVDISIADRGAVKLASLGTTGVLHQLTTLAQPQEGGSVTPDCSGGCTYGEGMNITLTATKKTGYALSHWTGCASSNGPQCVVTMDAEKSVTAHFAVDLTETAKLTINPIGSGTGTVISSPAGIDCGIGCIHEFNKGDVITLTATPANGSQFAGWGGDSDCTDGSLTMASDKNCMPVFNVVNMPPEAFDQNISTKPGIPVGITLTANDANGDVISFTIASQPANGTLGGAAPDLIYTPGNNYIGRDSFTFKASDGVNESALAKVTVTVSEGVDLTLSESWNLFGWIADEGCFEGVAPQENEYAAGAVLNKMPTFKECIATTGLTDTDYLAVVGPGGKVYSPGSPYNTLKSMLPGRAYWIYMTGGMDLVLPGFALAPDASLQLTNGWTLIGYWGLTGTPENAFRCINGSFDVVANGKGEVFIPDSPFNTLSGIRKEDGYFIYVTGAGTYTNNCQ